MLLFGSSTKRIALQWKDSHQPNHALTLPEDKSRGLPPLIQKDRRAFGCNCYRSWANAVPLALIGRAESKQRWTGKQHYRTPAFERRSFSVGLPFIATVKGYQINGLPGVEPGFRPRAIDPDSSTLQRTMHHTLSGSSSENSKKFPNFKITGPVPTFAPF